MSTLVDELERPARGLTLQEKANLARILIEELDPVVDAGVEHMKRGAGTTLFLKVSWRLFRATM